MLPLICKRIGVWSSQKNRAYLLLGILCLLGSLTLTAHAILTVSSSGLLGSAAVSIDGTGTLNLGTASSTGVVIGQTGTPITVPGSLMVTGTFTLGSASTTGQLLFKNASTSFTTILQPSPSQASNLTLTLPNTPGTSGQAMLTDGAGNLYFGSVGASQWLNSSSGTIYYSSGSIGINTSTPTALLSIVGNSTSPATLFSVASSIGASLFNVASNGKVTIGNTEVDPLLGISTPTAAVDPITSYHAAGVVTTTTGAISAGSRLLSVASAASWSVGMGIAVANAGSGGNTELISSVTAVNGTTLTLADAAVTAVSGQTITHDDTVAIASAIASGLPVHLRHGNYNITGGWTISSPITFYGDGDTSVIWNRSRTATLFTVNYEVAGGSISKANLSQIYGFVINQASGVTPTAGDAFYIGAADSGYYTNGVHIFRVHINGVWEGIQVGAGQITNWFTDLYIANTVHAGIYVNTPIPGGDDHWDSVELYGANAGLLIQYADTSEFSNIKLNNAGISFIDSGAPSYASTVQRLRFIDVNVENAPSCGVDFGTHGTRDQIQFIGGGIGLVTNPFCHITNATNLLTLVDSYPLGTGVVTAYGLSSITPNGDFALVQNSASPLQSIASGAVGGTIYLQTGFVGFKTVPIGSATLDIQGTADSQGRTGQISLGWDGGGYRHWIETRHDTTAANNAILFYTNNSASASGSNAPGAGNTLGFTIQNGNASTPGTFQAGGYRSSDGTSGFTGTCAAVSTITVKNGLITGCQ